MNGQEIKNIVQDYYNIDITSDLRKRNYVEARAIYFSLLRKNSRLSLEAIGKTVARHHATVLHNIRQLEGWIKYDKRLNADYQYLSNVIISKKDEVTEDDLATLESVKTQNHILTTKLEELKQINLELSIELKDVCEKYVKVKDIEDQKLLEKYGLI